MNRPNQKVLHSIDTFLRYVAGCTAGVAATWHLATWFWRQHPRQSWKQDRQ